MPRRRAAWTTMRLAIEPTISRLPASVLTSASIGPENGAVAAGSSSITAGKLGPPLRTTKGGAKNGARPRTRHPPAARPADPRPGRAHPPERGLYDDKPT